jgi:hypothetical protein
LLALEGEIVSLSCTVPPTVVLALVSLRFIPVTGTAGVDDTVTTHVAVYAPSSVVTEIRAVPAAAPVTRPVELTAAIEEASLDQLTF